jgi:hypothetical protein
MHLKLPKSNIEWTVETRGDGLYCRHDTSVTASFRMPSGETINNRYVVHEHMHPEAAQRAVDRLVEDLAREVGRRALGVR